jgi:O-antigen/teichoic acid export membrane protein
MSDALKAAGSSADRVHFTRGASYLIIQTFSVNAITVVAFVVLARLITVKEMGIWAVLQLLVAVCTTFITWFPAAVTKFVAENVSGGLMSKASAAFYQALRANIVLYIPVVAGFYLGSTFLAFHLLGDASYAILFRVLALDVCLSAGILPLATAALLGLRMFRQVALVSLIVGGLFRQILIISLILIMRNFVGLVIGWLVSDAITAAILLVMVMRSLGMPRFDFPLSKLFRFYLPMEFGQIMIFGQTWFDRALLVAFVPLATLGIYSAAVTAYGVVASVSDSMSRMLLPALSSIQGKTDGFRAFRDAARLATRYAVLTIIPIDLLLLATAKPALTLLIGGSYVSGSLPLMIFCAADALTAFATVMSPALQSLEDTTAIGVTVGVSVPIGLVIAYLLLPGWGIVGAAVGRASIILLIAILQFLVTKRKISLQLDFRMVEKTLAAGTVMAAIVAAMQLAYYSKFLLPLYGLVGVAVYFLMLKLLKIVEPADLDLLRDFVGRKFSIISSILTRILS